MPKLAPNTHTRQLIANADWGATSSSATMEQQQALASRRDGSPIEQNIGVVLWRMTLRLP
jgi:hypothetical protein